VLLLAAAVSPGTVVLAPPAEAAFPGQNGKLLFVRSDGNYSNYRLHVLNPDGSATLLSSERVDSLGHPEWSPDGTQIVYDSGHGFTIADANGTTLHTVYATGSNPDNPSWTTDGRIVYDFREYECPYGDPQCYVSNWGLRVMNADGTNDIQITFDGGEEPAWSPTGDKVAFVGRNDAAIHVANADGSNNRRLTSDSSSFNFWDSPAWSPDGKRLVFNDRTSPGNLWMINADGSGLRQLTRGSQSGAEADWSPDGSMIIFTWDASLMTIRPDGTNLTRLTATSHDGDATWQPVKPPGYARPRAATPVNVRLVPAYAACTSPNMSHGPPLEAGSCSPPAQASGYLTVGTPDSNLAAANFAGSIVLKASSPSPDPSDGDQADVSIQTSLTDVRKRADLTDYTGEVALVLPLRVTDRYSGTQYSPLIQPATAVDTPLRMSIACTATADVTIGSTCSATTSADALMPGIALERERAVWGLGQAQVYDGGLAQVQVYDGGADGDADTTGDNTLFAVPGLFVP
jgi:Tol biopolymer transport system component